MGLLDKIFGGDSEPQSEQEPETEPESEPELVIDEPGDEGYVHGTYRGEHVTFDREYSPNGDWQCLYARSSGSDEAPVVLIDDKGQIGHGFSVVRAANVAVANTGHIVVTDTGRADDHELGGTLNVVTPAGDPVIEHEFDANIWDCAISDDGEYASTATNNPDRKVYIFNTNSGEIVTEYESELNGPPQVFDRIDGEVALYLLESDSRYMAINLDGDVVWKSQELQEQEQLDELLERAREKDLEEAIELLEEAYKLADDEYGKKPIAQQLADTHWNLANDIRGSEGDTDEWWSHLNQAKEYYFEIISWSDGKKGVAKVQRKQAKYHLKEGNEEMALELLENIAGLEEEYDTQLLTDADKEKIENLS